MNLRPVLGLATSGLLALSLGGCGGGGGSSPSPAPTPTFTIGGTVTGLTGGQTLSLNDNGGDALAVGTNGTFTFATPVAGSGAYAVTVGTQPTAQGCRVFSGSGTVGTANVTTVNIRCRAEVAYVANMDSHSISQFTIGADGSLNPLGTPVNTGTTPKGIAVDPLSQYAYVTNYGDGTVSQYTIGVDGSLSPMTPATVMIGSGAPVPVTNPSGSAPNSIAVDPSGRYVYVTAVADSTVSQFTIGAGGMLVPMTNPTVATGSGPLIITLDPSGRFAYVANFYDPGATVSQYSIGANGALTPLSSPTVAIGTGRQPFGITIDPAGRYAYVEDYGNETATATGPATVGAILQFTIGADGTLAATGAAATTGLGPWPVVINSTGQYAFFTNNGDNTLSECTIGAAGVFSCSTLGANVLSLPRSVSIDPSGRYLYVTSQGNGDVSQFSIGAGPAPALTPIGSPGYVQVQVSPTFITTIR